MPWRIAINPLPWILDATTGFHLDRPSLSIAFSTLSEIGFTAVQGDVPDGFSPSEYLEFLHSWHLQPAPSYFGADFEDTDNLPRILSSARDHARTQRAIGNDMTFIAANLNPQRRAQPAIGAGFDPNRLAAVIAGLAATAQALTDEGLTPGLHPHVGTWIETENEVRRVLDSIPADILGFGPDTGHLRWAGMVPEEVMRDYSDRIVGVHLKDVNPAAAETARRSGADYAVATEDTHVWTEPGNGAVDFGAVFQSLPDGFDGWFMVEVDVPSSGDAAESSRASARWIGDTQLFDGSLR